MIKPVRAYFMPGSGYALNKAGVLSGHAAEHKERAAHIVPGQQFQNDFNAVFHPVFQAVPPADMRVKIVSVIPVFHVNGKNVFQFQRPLSFLRRSAISLASFSLKVSNGSSADWDEGAAFVFAPCALRPTPAFSYFHPRL